MITKQSNPERADSGSDSDPPAHSADFTVIVALARAVMDLNDRRVLRISPDNETDDWIPLDEVDLGVLVTEGGSLVTAFRRDVIGFDGDDDDSEAKAQVLASEMEAEGLLPVVWASGRPGHAQVVVVCPSAAAQQRLRTRAEELGFQWKRRSRGVLTPHRLGLPVALVHPATPQEALERLEQRQRRTPRGRLTPRTMALLRNGDPASKSGSEVVWKIAMGAVATGVRLEQIQAMLADPKNAGGDAYRRRASKSQAAAERWLRNSVWPRAEAYVADHPPIASPDDVREGIAAVRVEAAGFPWKPVPVERRNMFGRPVVETASVSSLRRGLEGVLDLGDRQGSIHITLSTTALIKASGLSKPTARKVRKALHRQGWITQVHAPTTSWAGIYRINLTGGRVAVPPVERPELKLLTSKSASSTGAVLAPSHTSPSGGVPTGGKQ